MSLLSRPFDEIAPADVHDLIARQAREGPTLDFKQAFDFSDSGKLDILGDVTAMANAAGGTLLYGAAEGDGDEAGMIVGLRPLAPKDFPPDETERRYLQLLRDSVDERIPGVRCRALAVEGGHLYVVRVPASPLAPHMVSAKSSRPRFFFRGNTMNEPMTARQIKEAAARGDVAFERAARRIVERGETLRRRDAMRREALLIHGGPTAGGLLVFHAVAVFPPRGGVDLADDALYRRFVAFPPPGRPEMDGWGTPRMSLDGLYTEFGNASVSPPPGTPFAPLVHALLLRDGGLEVAEFELLFAPPIFATGDRPGRRLRVDLVENTVLDALDAARDLTEAGVLTLPLAVGLQLFDVGGAAFASDVSRGGALATPPDGDVRLEPAVIESWGPAADATMRRLFDAVWQAWGHRRAFSYAPDGTRHRPRGG